MNIKNILKDVNPFHGWKNMDRKQRTQTLIGAGIGVLLPTAVYASGGSGADTTKIDTIINDVIVPWVQKLGLVIGFVGAIMFALGWRNDDADSKSRGIQTLISGFMAWGVASMYSSFSGN